MLPLQNLSANKNVSGTKRIQGQNVPVATNSEYSIITPVKNGSTKESVHRISFATFLKTRKVS
jgi:hypothetical protein